MRRRLYMSRRYSDLIAELAFSMLLGVFWFCLHFILTGSRTTNIPTRPVILPNKLRKSFDQDLMRTSNDCRYHSCFDVYRCNYNIKNIISVYTYPLREFAESGGRVLSPSVSKEFLQIINTIRGSDYHTSDLGKACLIVPPIDTLNQATLNITDSTRILSHLPSWKHDGSNHLIFNMLPGGVPDYQPQLQLPLGRAIIAGAGLSSLTYRPGFDISLPVFNTLTHMEFVPKRPTTSDAWFLISSQTNYHPEYHRQLKNISQHHSDVLLLGLCSDPKLTDEEKVRKRCSGERDDRNYNVYQYPEILQRGTFCLVLRGLRLSQSALMDALMMGCIPVVFADSSIMPFAEIIDWQRASVVLAEEDLIHVVEILKNVSASEISDMRQQIKHLWENYFSSIKNIVLTTLRIINDRVYPSFARTYQDWNAPLQTTKNQIQLRNDKKPFLLPIPLHTDLSSGFTAIIHSSGNEGVLFEIVTFLGQVPSLKKVLVLWSHQSRLPPQPGEWPGISKPIKVMQMKFNRPGSRFYPFGEITTEAVLQIDESVLSLSHDDVEFGYQVWCEFPDRLVGFSGGVHNKDNSTLGVKYISDWDNEISMVLTGAAFHHKMYSHLYTYMLPPTIRRWVDEQADCEDIAMNFLISNYSGKAPIKVTPRRGSKCNPTAEDVTLCEDSATVRAKCIKEFSRIHGKEALKAVQFRADPYLMGTDLPREITKFKFVGDL